MPIFDDSFNAGIGGSSYGYSGTRIDRLGASEYTLVTLTVDVSGSVGGFKTELEQCMSEVVRACRKAPRADNLMVRATAFDNKLTELHGFKPLTEVAPKDYDGILHIGGTTALYDAAHNAVAATVRYAEKLAQGGLAANGLAFVLTDGEDNASTLSAKAVKDEIARAVGEEALESMLTVLVGVGVGQGTSSALMKFSADAGFDHYIALDKADSRTLAGLAAFVSRNIQAQSVALGSGQASNLLTF